MDDYYKKIFNGKSLAVVGPSPHLVGKKLGNKLDNFDYIIRINEIVPKFLSNDYGSRNDIVFLTLPDNLLAYYKDLIALYPDEFSKVRYFISPRHSLHVTPYHLGEFHEDKNIFENFKKLNLPNKLLHIGNDENISLENEIGCHPTTGTLALSFISKFSIKQLFVCGFSFYLSKKRYYPHRAKMENKAYNRNVNKEKSGHDALKEITYLNKIFSNRNNVDGDLWFKEIVINKKYKVVNEEAKAPFLLRYYK